MGTYFEAINNKKRVTLDDEFRYLYYIDKVNLSNGAATPASASSFESSYGSMYYFRTLQFDKAETWILLQNSSFISQSSHGRYMAYIKYIAPDRLYGLRFLKKSEDTLIFLRICYTGLGAIISGDASRNAIMIEILTNDTADISLCNAYQDYFEICEIGNDSASMPACYNGIEIYSNDGTAIWNSNTPLINVIDCFDGALGDSVLYEDWNSEDILIPLKTIRHERMWDSSSFSRTHSSMVRDFYLYNSQGLTNALKTLKGTDGRRNYKNEKCSVWDPREFGSDSISNKLIAGIRARR